MAEFQEIIQTSAFAGIIGLVATFLFPYIFKVFTKILKRELGKNDKRLIVVLFSLTVSLGLSIYVFDWTTTQSVPQAIFDFVLALAANYGAFYAGIQTIYNMVIKSFPELEKNQEKIEKGE